jgi:hypothetical protein
MDRRSKKVLLAAAGCGTLVPFVVTIGRETLDIPGYDFFVVIVWPTWVLLFPFSGPPTAVVYVALGVSIFLNAAIYALLALGGLVLIRTVKHGS